MTHRSIQAKAAQIDHAAWLRRVVTAFAVLVALLLLALPARAQVTPFMQAVAESAAPDSDIAAFYRAGGYEPLWTGDTPLHEARRAALMKALMSAGDHALPVGEYEVDLLISALANVRSQRDLGRIEVELSRVFLAYAQDLQTGILIPAQVDSGIVREIPLRDRTALLTEFAAANPTDYLRGLAPDAPEYARLLKAKMALEVKLAQGGWGAPVPASALEPGDTGPAVVALRNRMIAMGFLNRSASASYDADLQAAVQKFQDAHGLEADGVAGAGTMGEINRSIEDRLPAIYVAIERERWTNMDRGDRHVWVNLTDFSATIVDHGEVTFRTRSVIGKNTSDRRTPEFSDVMEYMEINPYWNVPRSIAVKEYLPGMIASAGGSSRHLQLVDGRGRVVSRAAVDWSSVSTRNFPFDLRQPPSRGNALGLVKFMFPNRHNIYLHDTPAKNLFAREVRAYSHGCIRLNDPFDFAYALLAKQESDPVGVFQAHLQSGQMTRVELVEQVPVHLVYRTAFTTAKGQVHFRRDIYGRDADIFRALIGAGVVMGGTAS